jgi:uncharacterized lipoprotein YmbA
VTARTLNVPLRLALPLALVLTACTSPSHVADFAANDVLYVDVPFVTKAPGDRAVFVAPVADARDGRALPSHEKGFPIQYAGDEFWERPVTEMLGDVLARQLAASALFTAVSPHASADALVLKPSLVTFVGGANEAVSGARTFAEVALKVQVLGPAAADGKRSVLHEKVYGNRQTSALALKPVSPYRLYGPALQQTVAKLLAGLDGSNVARSNVPMDVGDAPAEASATK